MLKRLITTTLLAAVLVGCGQGPAPAVQPARQRPAKPPSSLKSRRTSRVSRPRPRPPQPPPHHTPTPTPSPTPTPEPWQAYRSKKLKYSMKYPPDWVATLQRPAMAIASTTAVQRSSSSTAMSAPAPSRPSRGRRRLKLPTTRATTTRRCCPTRRPRSPVGTVAYQDDGQPRRRGDLLPIAAAGQGSSGLLARLEPVDDDRGADKALFERMYKSFKPKS